VSGGSRRRLTGPSRAVLFDLRGMLVDATSSWCLADAMRIRFLRASGARGSDADLRRTLARSVAEVNALTFRRTAYFDQDRLVLERAAALSGLAVSDGQIASFEQWRNRAFERTVTAFPDARLTLVLLRALGLALGCVADGNREWTLRLLDRVGLLESLDIVVASEESGEVKATGAALRLACDRLGVLPRETLFVGDRRDKDVAMAAKVGAATVLLARGGLANRPPVPAVSSLLDLLDLPIRARKEERWPSLATT
jgi:HAD superfamily hydrolase (TIGR01549 family)